MPRQKGQTAAAANAAVTANAQPDVFSPGDGWYSIANAADYLKFVGKRATSKMRSELQRAPEFQADGAIKAITIAGTQIPPIVYVHQSALDAYVAAAASKPPTGKRGPKRDTKRFYVDIPHAIRETVIAALADQFGITARDASPVRAKKTAANGTAPADGDAPVDSTGAVVETAIA